MSRSNNRAILQLYILAGCFNTLYQQNAFARVDIKNDLKSGADIALDAIRNWPEPEFTNKDVEWVKSRRDKWRDFINDDKDESYSASVIVKMASEVASGLDEVLKNRQKRSMLQPLVEIANRVEMFNDPSGVNFQAFEKSHYLVGKMYKLIGMESYS